MVPSQAQTHARKIIDDLIPSDEREGFDRDVQRLVDNANLINQIEERRCELGISKEQLAEKVGKPRSSISRLLNGKHLNPTLNNLRDVTDALGIALIISVQKPDPLATDQTAVDHTKRVLRIWNELNQPAQSE